MNDQVRETTETRAVRQSEQLDWARLAGYVSARLAERGARVPSAAMTVEQFAGGHSNLTYLLRFGETEFVMRRPPLGFVAPRAHDMAREYRMLESVHTVFPLAPRPLLLCEDAEVIGATFYVMERRRGIIVRDAEPPQVASPDARRAVSGAVVDTLAELHRVDVQAHKLESLGKPSGFVARQVKGWAERWQHARIDEVAEMDEVARWLFKRLPLDTDLPTLVHGDFKLDNVMLDAQDATRVVGVFDWEMSAVGDPLVDLGILLSYWTHAPAAIPKHAALSGVTHLPGWFTRDEVIERYAAQSGRDISRIEFYEIFAVFKLAVVAQQIYYRYRHGQTDDERFAVFAEHVRALARHAAGLSAST